ncbi:ArsA family ATPase [Streptomyces fradiae]|uniref:ArsA family ATPase n=1 Tax=Streptomyces fradiae TaxID=1906 RepID=UPI002019B0A9|nr:ArsA-related P-loop ATPase [Streptomyces fradiae]UQS28523.1 ArsA family ATPase [Streptomyces fradiae]
MRTLLVTGPGGSGRTTIAAATALEAARDGRRVLLLTTDPAPGLPAGPDPGPGPGPLPAPAAGARPGPAPGPGPGPAHGSPAATDAPPAPAGLTVRRLDPAAHFRRELLALQVHAGPVLDLLGAAPLDDDELTPLPGGAPFTYLAALRDAARQEWDLVVADLPALPDAVALLALPEQLRRYLRRLLPPERRAARALRPMLAQLAGVPMPPDGLYEAAARKDADLAAVTDLLAAPTTRVRLVVEPGPAAAGALRTARAGLALHRLPLDAVVANRLLPTASPDPWLADLADRQRAHLKELYEDGAPVREVPHLGRDPRTPADLALLGPLAPDPADAAAPAPPWPVEDLRATEGALVWRVPLPGAVKSDLGLVRRGDELALTVGPFRRLVPLPSALRRCTVTGAALRDGELRVRFAPDPGLWPRTP